MAKVAFELRADHEDFSGGTVSLPGGEAFDVAAALKAGNGKITLEPTPREIKAPGDESTNDQRAKYAEKVAEENARARGDEQIVETLDSYPALKRASATSGGGGSASTSTEKAGDPS